MGHRLHVEEPALYPLVGRYVTGSAGERSRIVEELDDLLSGAFERSEACRGRERSFRFEALPEAHATLAPVAGPQPVAGVLALAFDAPLAVARAWCWSDDAKAFQPLRTETVPSRVSVLVTGVETDAGAALQAVLQWLSSGPHLGPGRPGFLAGASCALLHGLEFVRPGFVASGAIAVHRAPPALEAEVEALMFIAEPDDGQPPVLAPLLAALCAPTDSFALRLARMVDLRRSECARDPSDDHVVAGAFVRGAHAALLQALEPGPKLPQLDRYLARCRADGGSEIASPAFVAGLTTPAGRIFEGRAAPEAAGTSDAARARALWGWLRARMVPAPDLLVFGVPDHWHSSARALLMREGARGADVLRDDCDGHALTLAELLTLERFTDLFVLCQAHGSFVRPNHAVCVWRDAQAGDLWCFDVASTPDVFRLGRRGDPGALPRLRLTLPLRAGPQLEHAAMEACLRELLLLTGWRRRGSAPAATDGGS